MERGEIERVSEGVVDALNGLAPTLSKTKPGHGNWTRLVKSCLAETAGKHDCEGRCSGHKREFLFDVVWLKYSDSNLVDFILAVESEWGNQCEVLKDFDKLLLPNADVRLLVFDADVVGPEKLIAICLERIRRFRKFMPNGVWIFAGWKTGIGFRFTRLPSIDDRASIDV